jgi:putative radical SAM enzyme (TIGR03279 family)
MKIIVLYTEEEMDLVNTGVEIIDVRPSSIAEELGIKKGDRLITINGAGIKDILEYKYLTTDEFLEVEIEHGNGEIWIYEVEKEYDEDIGIVFEGIIDKPKSCHNKCIFCFIDQLPSGMRETLYFKDDDTRLSFLQGNFVTLTNLSEREIDRIIKYRISPINVSVHTTDPELRKMMLNNKNAGKLMDYLEKLKEGEIEVKAQIVLCPGVNDGNHLAETLKDLSALYPELSCVAVVPAGITKHRQGLYELKEYDEASAAAVIEQVRELQGKFLTELASRFVFLSDEFFLISGKALPKYNEYEGFCQLENGVGLITLFNEEVEESLKNLGSYIKKQRKVSLITGEYASPNLALAASKIEDSIEDLKISVIPIVNEFFGPGVKVAGLLTGKDIIAHLKGKTIGSDIFIPECMLKSDETVFLDNVSIEQVEKELGARVTICKEDGSDLVSKILSL